MGALDGTITMTYNEYRPCEVDGKKALFHRWAKTDKPVAKVNCVLDEGQANKLKDWLHRKTFDEMVDSRVEITHRLCTVAIVEFEDGTVADVFPTQVRFLDSRGLFADTCFGEMEETT